MRSHEPSGGRGCKLQLCCTYSLLSENVLKIEYMKQLLVRMRVRVRVRVEAVRVRLEDVGAWRLVAVSHF